MLQKLKTFFGREKKIEEEIKLVKPAQLQHAPQLIQHIKLNVDRVTEDPRLQSSLLARCSKEEALQIIQRIPSCGQEGMVTPEQIFSTAEYIVLGDMNGSLGMQISHLVDGGVVDRARFEIITPVKKRTLVFLGDILADRVTEGIPCLENILLLKEAGYEVQALIGNHDQWFLSYLFSSHDQNPQRADYLERLIVQCQMYEQGKGLLELLPYATHTPLEGTLSKWFFMEDEWSDIRKNIVEQNPLWYQSLQQLSYYFFDQEKKVLFLHTPPTTAIIEVLLYFLPRNCHRYTLREALRENIFEQMGDIFAHTNARVDNYTEPQHSPHNISHEDWKALHEAGIEKIFFGHDQCDHMCVSDYFPHATSIQSFACDGGSWKGRGSALKRSLAGIQGDGLVLGSRKFGEVEYF